MGNYGIPLSNAEGRNIDVDMLGSGLQDNNDDNEKHAYCKMLHFILVQHGRNIFDSFLLTISFSFVHGAECIVSAQKLSCLMRLHSISFVAKCYS